jgi:hypothetical protein
MDATCPCNNLLVCSRNFRHNLSVLVHQWGINLSNFCKEYGFTYDVLREDASDVIVDFYSFVVPFVDSFNSRYNWAIDACKMYDDPKYASRYILTSFIMRCCKVVEPL